LAPRLAQQVAGTRFQRVQYFPNGTAGSLLALRQGMDLLRQQACLQCVVGGVDSWLDEETLVRLDEVRRLKSASNPDAFVPGEAASFVVLELQSNAQRRKQEAYAECGDVAVAEEKNTIWTDTPCTAEALSQCLRPVLTSLAKGDKRPDVVLCDLNGESYRSTEWGYAMTRAFRDGQPVPPLMHPADCVGDVGAAIGGILVGLGAFVMKKNLAPWKAALVWCSSDNGERAACAITKR
jgi:3-oxoacyl-[acyl-carrier-protein] synthase-1